MASSEFFRDFRKHGTARSHAHGCMLTHSTQFNAVILDDSDTNSIRTPKFSAHPSIKKRNPNDARRSKRARNGKRSLASRPPNRIAIIQKAKPPTHHCHYKQTHRNQYHPLPSEESYHVVICFSICTKSSPGFQQIDLYQSTLYAYYWRKVRKQGTFSRCFKHRILYFNSISLDISPTCNNLPLIPCTMDVFIH